MCCRRIIAATSALAARLILLRLLLLLLELLPGLVLGLACCVLLRPLILLGLFLCQTRLVLL